MTERGDIDIDLGLADEDAPGAADRPGRTGGSGGVWHALVRPDTFGLVGFVLAAVGLFGKDFIGTVQFAVSGPDSGPAFRLGSGGIDLYERQLAHVTGAIGLALGGLAVAAGLVALWWGGARGIAGWARTVGAAGALLGLVVAVVNIAVLAR